MFCAECGFDMTGDTPPADLDPHEQAFAAIGLSLCWVCQEVRSFHPERHLHQTWADEMVRQAWHLAR